MLLTLYQFAWWKTISLSNDLVFEPGTNSSTLQVALFNFYIMTLMDIIFSQSWTSYNYGNKLILSHIVNILFEYSQSQIYYPGKPLQPVINEGPAFFANHLQRSLAELAVIRNFHQQRPHRGVELGILWY